MSQTNFVHEIGSPVALVHSNETGVVIGRAQFMDQANQYLIRYKAADGRQVQDWWAESATAKVNQPATA